jgi:hypothetical protein
MKKFGTVSGVTAGSWKLKFGVAISGGVPTTAGAGLGAAGFGGAGAFGAAGFGAAGFGGAGVLTCG